MNKAVALPSRGGRDITPDILRGFALWGIIVVNVAYFSTSVDSGITPDALVGFGNQTTAFLVFALAQGKFYLIFSFLFGYSAHYLLRNGLVGRRRWWLRSIGLIVLGAVHAALLFIGDILFLYGLLGLSLLPLYGRTRKVLFRWAASIYALFFVAASVIVVLTFVAEAQGEVAGVEPSAASLAYESAVMSHDYIASIPLRFDFWLSDGVFLFLVQGALTLVAFIAGVLAARWNALNADGLSAGQLRKMVGWGIGAGLTLQLLFAGIWLGNALLPEPSEAIDVAAFFGGLVTAPLLSVGYIALVVILVRSFPRALTWVGTMGRMSLTMYLSQSILLNLVFGGWGLGLYQRLPYWVAVVSSLGIVFVLAISASFWLQRFEQGPMERLLAGWSRIGLGKSSSR